MFFDPTLPVFLAKDVIIQVWVGILSFFLVLFLLYTFLSFVVLYQSSDYYGGTLKTRSFKGYRTWSIMLWTLRKNIQLFIFIHVLFIYRWWLEKLRNYDIMKRSHTWESLFLISRTFYWSTITFLIIIICIDPSVFFPFSTSGVKVVKLVN